MCRFETCFGCKIYWVWRLTTDYREKNERKMWPRVLCGTYGRWLCHSLKWGTLREEEHVKGGTVSSVSEMLSLN